MTGTDGAPVIVVDENPDPGLREEILKPLRAFNESRVGTINVQPLAIFLRDSGGDEIIGGLWGQSAADWLFVDLLFVPEKLRMRGIGTSLMRTAEEIALRRGCIGLWLYTGSFQAPGFYEKLGFKRFGILPDYPKGHKSINYFKRLDG